MPLDAIPDVVGDSHVVPCGVAIASKDVDDSLLDSVHTTSNARAVPSEIAHESDKATEETQILRLTRHQLWKKGISLRVLDRSCPKEEGGPPSRLPAFAALLLRRGRPLRRDSLRCGDSLAWRKLGAVTRLPSRSSPRMTRLPSRSSPRMTRLPSRSSPRMTRLPSRSSPRMTRLPSRSSPQASEGWLLRLDSNPLAPAPRGQASNPPVNRRKKKR